LSFHNKLNFNCKKKGKESVECVREYGADRDTVVYDKVILDYRNA